MKNGPFLRSVYVLDEYIWEGIVIERADKHETKPHMTNINHISSKTGNDKDDNHV